jgi:hypothetical protein
VTLSKGTPRIGIGQALRAELRWLERSIHQRSRFRPKPLKKAETSERAKPTVKELAIGDSLKVG